MAKIPKFKDRNEERKFWATHDLADFADDTEVVQVDRHPKDTNPTRQKRWPIQVYLTPEEGLALESFAERTGESRNSIVRAALRKYIVAQSPTVPIDPRAAYLKDTNLGPTEKVTFLHVQLLSANPKRDHDLARKLKSILQVAYPGAGVVEVMVRKLAAPMAKHGMLRLADDPEVGGSLSAPECKLVCTAVAEIAERTIGQQLRARHPIAEVTRRAVNE
ncbi:MAG: hypothetical protein HY815_10270 [Candidatus Riflebacteria bacterium]|nr:hypothetical protein [Candidatus Riflebacteria bacterium]